MRFSLSSFFENSVLQEAVPRKARELNIKPDTPPDLTKENPSQPPQPQEPEQQQMEAPPQDAAQDDMGGGEQPAASAPPDMPAGDPNAGGGEEEQPTEGEPGNEEDPSASDDMAGAETGQESDPDEASEQEIFKDIKPEQQEIMKRELKEKFLSFNQMVTDSIQQLNKSTKTSYDTVMIDFILRKLILLKDLSRDSLISTFETRTYVENVVTFRRMLALFTSLTQLVEEISKSRIKRRQLETEKREHMLQKTSNTPDDLFHLGDIVQDVGW